MSLLDGPESVTVTPDIDGTDSDGTPVRKPGVATVTVAGQVQYTTASRSGLLSSRAEDATDGQSVTTEAMMMCRSFPSGFGGKVTWDGRDWDVVGEPTVHGSTPATRHTVVRLRARTPQAVA